MNVIIRLVSVCNSLYVQFNGDPVPNNTASIHWINATFPSEVWSKVLSLIRYFLSASGSTHPSRVRPLTMLIPRGTMEMANTNTAIIQFPDRASTRSAENTGILMHEHTGYT